MVRGMASPSDRPSRCSPTAAAAPRSAPPRPAPPRPALSLLAPLLFLLLLGAPAAHAQLLVRGELEAFAEASTTVTATGTGIQARQAAGLVLRGSFDARYALDGPLEPLELRATLDPLLRVAGAPALARFEPGVSEAVARVGLARVTVEAGLLQRPLQQARLSVPFRLEGVDGAGRPLPLAGASATVFADPWRLRPTVAYRPQDGAFGGGASVRRDFRDFDLEAHAFHLGGLALGLGGSGLVGDLVVYGEGWLLGPAWAGRGALGVSGFAGEALWTAEAAYAPLQPGGADAAPQLLARVGLPLRDDVALDATLALALAPSGVSPALQGRGEVAIRRTAGDHQALLGVGISRVGFGTTATLRFGAAAFF